MSAASEEGISPSSRRRWNVVSIGLSTGDFHQVDGSLDADLAVSSQCPGTRRVSVQDGRGVIICVV